MLKRSQGKPVTVKRSRGVKVTVKMSQIRTAPQVTKGVAQRPWYVLWLNIARWDPRLNEWNTITLRPHKVL